MAGKTVVGGKMEVNGQVIPISRGMRAKGEFVFASGQLPLDKQGKLVGEDIETQTRQVLENVKAILEQAGTTLDNVVKCTCWVASADHFPGFNKVYREFFPKDPPARSCVVSGFVVKRALVEVEAVAPMPEQENVTARG